MPFGHKQSSKRCGHRLPCSEGLVLNAKGPSRAGARDADGNQTVAVVVDSFLGRKLRPHQKEGVQFLYDCVMGLKGFNRFGAILADQMGLG